MDVNDVYIHIDRCKSIIALNQNMPLDIHKGLINLHLMFYLNFSLLFDSTDLLIGVLSFF